MSSQEDCNTDSSTADSQIGSVSDNANLFEPKSQPKIIRVLTVLAYVLSVSMAAILLSIYYIFMWEGKPTAAGRRSHVGIYHEDITTNESKGPIYSHLKHFGNDLDVYHQEISTEKSNGSRYSEVEYFGSNRSGYEVRYSKESTVPRYSRQEHIGKALIYEKLMYSPVSANVSIENGTDFNEEMQQQITAYENEVMSFPSGGTTEPPTTTTEENMTFPDYEILPSESEDLKTSAFIKRLMYFRK